MAMSTVLSFPPFLLHRLGTEVWDACSSPSSTFALKSTFSTRHLAPLLSVKGSTGIVRGRVLALQLIDVLKILVQDLSSMIVSN